jgi:hypothetical protein
VQSLIVGWNRQAWSLRKIADELNRLGIRTASGAKWYAVTVLRVLRGPSPAGSQAKHRI